MAIVLFLAMGGSFAPSTSRAFSHEGHDIIEAQAYLRLLNNTSSFLARYPGITGKHILDTLIAIGVLTAPDCWVGNYDCHANPNDPLRTLPVLRSGEVDYLMAEQLSSQGQLIHFMARSYDLYATDSVNPLYDGPCTLLDSAYPRVIRYLTNVYAELLASPRICCEEQHNVYVLIHSICDSYSAAHVHRDTATWKICCLKAWQARAWLPYLIHWSGWKYFFTDKHHYMGFEPRDEGFATCPDVHSMSPYGVPWDCMTERGKRATHAVEDLLVTIYGVIRGSEERQSAWQNYVERELDCAKPELSTSCSLADALARYEPHSMLGVQYRQITERGQSDLLLVGNIQSTQIGPVAIGFAGGIGMRTARDYRTPSMFIDLNYSLPLTDGAGLSMSPIVFDFVSHGSEKNANFYLSYLRLDLFPTENSWIRIEGPRYSYFQNKFTNEFLLAIGRTFDLSIERVFNSPLRTIAGISSERRPLGDEWKIPEYKAVDHYGPTLTSLFTVIGAGFERSGSSVFAMYEYLRDRTRFGFRSGTGWGFYGKLGVGQLHVGPNGAVMFGMIGAGPELRFRLPLLGLPLALMPSDLEFVSGHQLSEALHWSGMVSWPIDLGAIELDFGLLRYDYKAKLIDQPHFPAEFRLAFSYHESHALRLVGF